MGEPFGYSVRVSNVAKEPVHSIVLREQMSGAVEITSLQQESDQQGGSQQGSDSQQQQ